MTLLCIYHLNVYNGGMSRRLEILNDKLTLHFVILIFISILYLFVRT